VLAATCLSLHSFRVKGTGLHKSQGAALRFRVKGAGCYCPCLHYLAATAPGCMIWLLLITVSGHPGKHSPGHKLVPPNQYMTKDRLHQGALIHKCTTLNLTNFRLKWMGSLH
jgi:hypothetical protein